MGYPEELMEMMWAADDDDLPDGAWQAVIEDAVTMYNQMRGTEFDPFEAWLYYIESDWRTNKLNGNG